MACNMWRTIIIWLAIFIAVVSVTIGGLYLLRTRNIGPLTPIVQSGTTSGVRSTQSPSPTSLTQEQKALMAQLEQIQKMVPEDILSTWKPEDLNKRSEAADLHRKELESIPSPTSTQL